MLRLTLPYVTRFAALALLLFIPFLESSAERKRSMAEEASIGEQDLFTNSFWQSGKRRSPRLISIRWYVFYSPDEDFRIKFPGKPRFEEGVQEEGEIAVRRRYSYYGNRLWLSISFQDLGFPPDSRQANDLGPHIEQILATRTRERGGKTIRMQRLAKNILEEERWIPSKQSSYYRHVISRIIQRNSRMYTLGCVPLVDGQEIDKRICRRFFNSFQIIGAPQ